MALYRDAVARCSIAQVRMSLPPRVYRRLTEVRVEHEGIACVVAIERHAVQGCVVGARRWFRCPRCGGRANVLGLIDGAGWACRTCGGWRSRNRARAPTLGESHDPQKIQQ